MANRTIRTPEKEAELLEFVASTGGNITRACEMAGISRTAVYDWKAEDAGFAAKLEEACERGVDALEDEATRRAFHGTSKPVFHQGEQCGIIQEYSDTLMIFLLKARRKEKFSERLALAHSGSIGIGELTDEQRKARIAYLTGELGARANSPPGGGTQD